MDFNRCMGCMEELNENDIVCSHCGYKKGTPSQKPIQLESETILHGRYVVGKALGVGGFGITYIAWDIEMGRKVAVKEYFPSEFATRYAGQPKISVYSGERGEQFFAGLSSFTEEAKNLAKFNSINGIVHVFDTFSENGTAYIVMELLEGETLKELAKREGKVSYEKAIELMIPVLRELENVHKVGVIHRDIAPDNIYLTNDGKVKLIDFGAAKHATQTYSRSLSVIVKPGYAPEEQYRSKGNQGPWTDVYAASATLYRLITGKVPYPALDRKAGNKKLEKPSELGINIPADIETAIMNGLNIYAENRYQSAKEFADVLERLVPAKEIEEVIIEKTDGKLSKKVIAALAGGITVAVAILIVLLSTGTLKTLTAERLPNVIEMSVEEAAQALAVYGYSYITDESSTTDAENKIRIEDTVYDSAIPEDMILAQSPNAGAKVNVDKYPDIYLTLSAGAKEVYFDLYLVGMEKEAARKLVEDLGFTASFTEESNAEYAAGYICAQQYAQGTKLKEGDTIELTVSTGIKDGEKVATKVPAVVGKTQESAQEILTSAKLYTAVKSEEYSNTIPKGSVISQTPSAGSDAITNETVVSVVISKGAKADETTRVPDVTYRKQANAVTMLKNANLNYKVVYAYSNNVASGTVISQSHKADTKVKIGTTITITVSKGAKNDSNAQKEQATQRPTTTTTKPTTTADNRITLPNVVGLTEASAKSKLSSCVVSVTYGYCDTVAKGKVIKQTPSANTKVNAGSTVTLIVSMGSKESNYSSWTTTKPTGNVITEQKTQYRSRTITQENVYSSWSSVKSTSTKPTESATLQITGTWTQYNYYHYCNYYYNGGNNWNVDSIAYGSQSHLHRTNTTQKLPAISFQDKGNKQAYGGTGASVTRACPYNFYIWFYEGETKYYNYQTRTITDTKTVYGNWSSWGDAKLTESNTLDVETRTVYRYCPNYKTYNSSGTVIS